MRRFHDQDLTGARFERVILRDAEMKAVVLNGSRMRGVELVDVDISGELQNVIVNGVDIAPLVEAELNRRMPQRAKMRFMSNFLHLVAGPPQLLRAVSGAPLTTEPHN